jgi:hypothetical protein
MTGRVRLFLVTALAVAIYPAVTAAPAAAGTTVSGPNRNNVVTITVPIDCVGCKDWIDPINGGDLAKYWEKTAEKMWQEAFDKYSYCNKYHFKLDIKMTNRSAGSGSGFGGHELLATEPDGRGFRGAGWGGAPESTPGGPEGQRAADGTRYYEFDAQGTMPADATPTVIAHEFGHVIGLGDDRDADGNPIGPDPKGIMVGGANGVTPNTKLKIGKNHVDRIGDQLANLGKITCGQAWKGTLDGTGVNTGQPGVLCPDPSAHSGNFSMTVRPDGKATLTGHMVNTSVCVGGFTTEVDFTLEGKKTGSTITFAPVATFPFEVNLRVRGDRASGTSTTSPGDFYTVTVNLAATCQNCDENVG